MAQLSEADLLYRPFARMADEQLVAYARRGCKYAVDRLLDKYRAMVEGKARSFFIAGADREDVVQEGMIGLFKAIRDFSAGELSPFRSFAELCITRQIITAIKAATRQKHSVLSACVSIDDSFGDHQVSGQELLVDAACQGPEQIVAGRQFRQRVRRKIESELSDMERTVLVQYLEGRSYKQAADELGLSVKQVDNALQRAKNKLEGCARDIGVLPQ